MKKLTTAIIAIACLAGVLCTDSRAKQKTLREKLDSIIIPKLEFRDAALRDVLNMLSELSRELDPDGVGVNIILKEDVKTTAPKKKDTGKKSKR